MLGEPPRDVGVLVVGVVVQDQVDGQSLGRVGESYAPFEPLIASARAMSFAPLGRLIVRWATLKPGIRSKGHER